MPPKARSFDKEKERAKLAALFGEETVEVVKIEVQKAKTKDIRSRDGEAVLAFLARRGDFLERPCSNCQRMFAVDYACIAYCSDQCREQAFLALGMLWNPEREEYNVWRTARAEGYDAPLIVRPAAFEALTPLDSFLDSFDDLG